MRSDQDDRIGCHRCRRRFRTRSDLIRHLRRVHGLRFELRPPPDRGAARDGSTPKAGEQYPWPWVDFGERVEQYLSLPEGAPPVEAVEVDERSGVITVSGGDGTTIGTVDLPEADVQAGTLDWDTDREGYVRLTFYR